MTDNIKPGSVILIGIAPADGKPTPEQEIFGSVGSAVIAIYDDAVSYDVFEAIRLGGDGKWSSCWNVVQSLLEDEDEAIKSNLEKAVDRARAAGVDVAAVIGGRGNE